MDREKEEIIQSLRGCIRDEGMTLEEYRDERLRKYEADEKWEKGGFEQK